MRISRCTPPVRTPAPPPAPRPAWYSYRPRFAKDAIAEAIEAGIELIVVITEGIPVADSAYCVELALQHGVRIVGPNCPGLITLPSTPDGHGVNLGIIPDGIVPRGPLGLVSKSGTLTYQLMGELSDIGFTACLGAGGDPIVGTTLQGGARGVRGRRGHPGRGHDRRDRRDPPNRRPPPGPQRI